MAVPIVRTRRWSRVEYERLVDIGLFKPGRDYRGAHPSRPGLLVEVADATVSADRRKGSLYARARVPEYWIVNLMDEVVEVYRRPSPDVVTITSLTSVPAP